MIATIQTVQLDGQEAHAIGNVALLNRFLTGLIASRKCPAGLILEAHKQFKQWTGDPEVTIMSGFHSPLEQECLRLLLQGEAGIIAFLARSLESFRVPRDWKTPIENNRLLILSTSDTKRITRTSALERNAHIERCCRNVHYYQ